MTTPSGKLLALLLLAGCTPVASGSFLTSAPAFSPAFTSGSVSLRGPQANVRYQIGNQTGAIVVPAQISVPPGDSVRLTAGSKPQAGMPSVPLVPAATTQFVYTAIYFTKATKTGHGLALHFALPPHVDPKVGTYFLAAFDRKRGTWNSEYATPIQATSHDISMAPNGGAVTYPANTAIGIALYRISSKIP